MHSSLAFVVGGWTLDLEAASRSRWNGALGYFDTIDEMETVYEQHKGHTGLVVDESGWRLVR